MATSDPNRPAKHPLPDAGTTPPACMLPLGLMAGDLLSWDGFNLARIPYPTTPNGQHLVAGTDGPFWQNP